MTITIGSFTCNKLTAQPFGYEGEARRGLTAKTFQVSGLLTPEEWAALLVEYNTWRDLRIEDEDTKLSKEVGTTIDVTIEDANGISASAVPCWFTEPPEGDQAGVYISATATLVDAAEALQVILKTEEKDAQQEDEALLEAELGTLTLGAVVIQLTRPPDTRQDGPTLALTAGGVSYVTGPLAAHEVLEVEGYIKTGTYADLLSWYDTAISTRPAAGALFPTVAPTATAEAKLVEGEKTTQYNVRLTLFKVI